MPLTLVIGPANSAKAGELLGAYAAAAPRGAVLVVPTAQDADHYLRELVGAGTTIGTNVLTFPGLAREIARRAGYAGRRLSTLQRTRLLAKAVANADLRALNESAQAKGFPRAAGGLIAELQRSLVTPQRFAQAIRTWAAQDERRAAYAEDLASIYLAYSREANNKGCVDGDLFAWQALDALRQAPHTWGDGPVFFYGFDDLTPLERDAIETLARIANVTVSLTYEPGHTGLEARAEAVEELRPLAAVVKQLPALDEHYAPESRTALHALERGLFEQNTQRVDPGDAVRLLESGGERAEAELVTAEVAALLRNGVPASEIVVVYRTPERVAPLITRAFAAAGVPLATRASTPFAHTALGRGLTAMLRAAQPDGRATDVLRYLRTPGILRRTELADRLEAQILREGLNTAAEARDRLQLSLGELDAEPDDVLKATARHARRLFAAPHAAAAPHLDGREQLDARALATALQALEQLQELGDQPSANELLELLEELEVPPGRTEAEGVLLADPLAIRARRFRAVFICGLNEGEFPLPGSPDPFLSDELRRELAAATGLRLPIREDALTRERYLFYAATSRATETLVLSYRSSDEEGNLTLPSPFIADVAELYTDTFTETRRKRLLADVVWPAAEAPTERELAKAQAAATAPLTGDPEPPAKTLTEATLETLRHREVVSAGALETFADCPVRWLVERELQPAALEPEPEPIARGNYMHEVLEELLKRLERPITDASLADAHQILDGLLQELPGNIAPGRPEPIRAAVKQTIDADLRRYIRHEAATGSDWEPAGLELTFGFEDSELPALQLGDDVLMRGMIDRVDVDPGHGQAIVRDYKSGRVRADQPAARWATDRRLQVALYMLAVRRLLGIEPVAGLYQPLSGDDLRARGVFLNGTPVGSKVVDKDGRDQDELDELLADAEARAIEIAAKLRTGELRPCPQTCSRSGCAYPGICRST
jgi:ATP-dependent helicase/DNAse subunit B